MQAVRDIVQASGYPSVDAMGVGDHVEIEPDTDGLMPLVIEKIDEDRVSVAHYYTQMDDRMADPEIVFHIDTGVWTPVRYVQHPYVEEHDPNGLDMDGFVAKWNQNLREQGYVAAAHAEVTAE